MELQMMYNNKMAVALKHKGKVLREFKEEVYIPFGAEYSIFIKNMNSVRALVTVTVDGVDIGDGTQFVVKANDTIEIERFIKDGNFDKGNSLKFIERSGAVEEHRGIDVEDGLVRVEYQFEKPTPAYIPPYIPPKRWNDYPYDNIFYTANSAGSPLRSRTIGDSSDAKGLVQSTFTASASAEVSNSVNVNNVQLDALYSAEVGAEVENDVGVTVEGSVNEQQFSVASWFPVEAETHVIVLKMLGQTKDNAKVRKPVTVKTKPKCKTCNTANKATSKFCTECGTSLQIV
jgi:hypothetical protein